MPKYFKIVKKRTRSANGNNEDILPVPATFVIDKNGTFSYIHFDTDYSKRASVKEHSSTFMNKHEIQVKKTARYFTLGTLDESTQTIWFLLHGYAQLANDFLASCAGLQNDTTYLIAPEGLSRFYFKDFVGKPGASWMTSEERESEMQDYITYLECRI